MIPKSHKTFIKPVSEKLELKEDLINDVVGFYYGEVRKLLNEMQYPNITLKGLGTFKVKTKNLNKLIQKLDAQSGYLENPINFNQMSAKKGIEAKLNAAKKLQVLVEEEKERKNKIYEERIKKDMGE